jgi:hypothetical protein
MEALAKGGLDAVAQQRGYTNSAHDDGTYPFFVVAVNRQSNISQTAIKQQSNSGHGPA